MVRILHSFLKIPIVLLITFSMMFSFSFRANPVQNLEEDPIPTYYEEENSIVKQETLIGVQIPIQVETVTEVEQTTEVETTAGAQETQTIKQKEEKKSQSNFGAFKSYTDYRCLSRSSAQWKLQEQAYTDENGLRKIDDCYLVALGSYYGIKLGTRYVVTLSTGKQFNIILCDVKDDRHTNGTHQYTRANGCVLEFYVEADKIPKKVRQLGSISAIEEFKGSVVSIEKTTE